MLQVDDSVYLHEGLWLFDVRRLGRDLLLLSRTKGLLRLHLIVDLDMISLNFAKVVKIFGLR